MKTILRRTLKITAWVIGIFLVIWLLVWMYVLANKKSLISKVTTELNSRIKAEVLIGDFEPSLISTFPHVSLRISNLSLRDTMWKEHHHDLLKAENVLIRLGMFSLFTGHPVVKKVIVEKASIYVFSDTSGYTNTYMFSSHDSSGKGSARKVAVPDVELNGVRLTLDLKARSKLYDFDIHRLNCNVAEKSDRLQLNLRMDVLVHSLAFNADSGSFVKEKPVEGKFTVDFYQEKKKLQFDDVQLKIADHPYTLSGMFDLLNAPILYFLDVKTKQISYKEAASLISQNLTRKLERFNIEQPFDVHAVLDGTTRPNKTPVVTVDVQAENTTASTPKITLTDASFTARFSNRLDPKQRAVNNNSGFTFRDFSAKWEGVPFQSKLVTLNDLDHPVLRGDLQAHFDLKDANTLVGSNTLAFEKGTGDVNLIYRGPIMPGDTAAVSIVGSVLMKDADLTYLPRNLLFANSSGTIEFADKDVYVKDLKTTAANSPLIMNGSARNLVALLDKNPETINLDWMIRSTRLDLGNFIAFLGKRNTRSRTSKKNISAVIKQLDRMLENCHVNLKLNSDRLTYKSFDASNLGAEVELSNDLISLKKVSLQHAGGSLNLSGSLAEKGTGNQLNISTHLNNVNVPVIFRAFDNFGQTGITDKNLKGRLDATVNLTGFVTDKAGVADNSLHGKIDFNLKEGELIDFEPIEKISAAALNNKGVSSVRFADLQNTMDLNGSRLTVNRMEIRSSAFTMFVEGLYDLKKGSDLSIQIPLNNLTKSKSAFTLQNKGTKSKTGVSLWLRAKSTDENKAKISWDPFKKGVKERRKNAEDSLQTAVSDSSKVGRKK